MTMSTDVDRTASDVAWDLEGLVDGRGEAGVDALLDEAATRADEIATRFRNRVGELDGSGLTELMHGVADVAGELFDAKAIALRHSILLSARFDDRVHGTRPLR